jgi:hypothetical protein
MILFGSKLQIVELRIIDNLRKTKEVFPEETGHIEVGLELMGNLTTVTKEASKEYPNKPNLFANHNLFARNRQLSLNAYTSLLFSSYGTEFVIVRTILENNNLMRLFNKNPQFAYEWLPENLQKRFAEEIRTKYGETGAKEKYFDPKFVRAKVFGEQKKTKIRDDIDAYYSDLCNYTHPKFEGWKELVFIEDEQEKIQNMPMFREDTAELGVGVALFTMQTTFKSIVETFRGYWHHENLAFELTEWQSKNLTILPRYIPQK